MSLDLFNNSCSYQQSLKIDCDMCSLKVAKSGTVNMHGEGGPKVTFLLMYNCNLRKTGVCVCVCACVWVHAYTCELY